MKSRLAVQDYKKGSVTPGRVSLQHAAVHPHADHVPQPNLPSTLTESRFEQDFSGLAVQSPARATRSDTTQSCGLTPRTCPFGGACHPCPARVQTKLIVNEPGDIYEREADEVAGRVMRMTEPHLEKDDLVRSTPHERLIQRKCAECDDEDETLQKKESPGGTRAMKDGQASVPPIVHEVLRSPGQPLNVSTRAFFEPRFGHDFSQVRVHTDTKAAESAQAMNALAYTGGHDMVFGAGQYTPNTRVGQRLMAHELTHTLQQTRGLKPTIQRKLEVGAGLSLDTKGFTTTKTGNVYTCPSIVKNSTWNEIFTSLLFSPRVFKIDGTSNAQINGNLDKHRTARHGIVEFASKKRYTFPGDSGAKMNPKFWEVLDPSGHARLKPGVDKEKAIQDLNVHPKEYQIYCAAASLLTMVGGSKSPLTPDMGVAVTDWIPGDWGYITNTKFPSGGTPGLEGENIIYTGKDKFWGHFGPGNEYKTLKEWFDQVKGWHGGAETKDVRKRPTIGLV